MELSDNIMYETMQRLILLHYQKILYVNLTEDFYSILKIANSEWNMCIKDANSHKISEWFDFFSCSSLCHENDKAMFKRFSNLQSLIEIFNNNSQKPLRVNYQRKLKESDMNYIPCVMELFPFIDKNNNQIVFLFVREVTFQNYFIENTSIELMDENEKLIKHNTNIGKRKILIIDDDSSNISILKSFLQNNYDVIDTSSQLKNFDMLVHNYQELSAIIIDLYSSQINGFEFLERIQLNPILSSIPILASSSKNNITDEERAFALGATDFIQMPYNPYVVEKRLEKIILTKEKKEFYSNSEYDSLTGFYTRDVFLHYLDIILNKSSLPEFDLIVTTISNIYSIEQFYGKEAVNKLIKNFASTVHSAKIPSIVSGRVYDNMFAGVVVHSDSFDEDFFKSIASQFIEISPIQNIKIKFGAYRNIDKKVPAVTLLKRITTAMESINHQYGVAVAYYDSKLVDKQAKDNAMESSFEKAIEQEQFEVWLQPKYSSKTKNVSGAEALIRWRGDDGKLIPPGEFISLFERDGLISILDEYVFKKVCQYQKKRLLQKKEVVPISVNLSRLSLSQKDFVKKYTNIAKSIEIDPYFVPIELTESVALKSREFKVFAEELINNGFSLHMDDFGSGYSSLASLQILRFDVIKLDKSLIDFIGTPSGESLIKHTIAFAKESGMNIVAEGVENKKQLDFLQKVGCDYIQGFYFSPPIQKSEFEKLLQVQI